MPGFSAHNYGCATDWAEFRPEYTGKQVWDKAKWPEYSKAVKSAGLVWGGDWNGNGKRDPNDFDLPHNQLAIRISYSKVGAIYRAKGLGAANKAIFDNLIGG